MSEFFFQYGLFAAKLITIAIVLVFIIALLGVIKQARNKDRESIEINNLNDELDSIQEAIEEEIYSKEELKAIKKQRKKSAKNEDDTERNKVFVIDFYGDMEASAVENLRETITAILMVAKASTDEVIVKLESSGGLVHNYGLAASQLQRIRERGLKLTVAVDLIAASGGYMMACVANQIIAAPFAVLGSIGVLAQIPNFNRALEKLNVDMEQHTAGDYKTTLTMFGRNTDKDREKFKEELQETHILFKQFVQKMRPQLDIDKIATGEHWYGIQAIDLKLADRILTSDDYLLEQKAHSEIYAIDYVIHESIKDKLSTFLNNFLGKCLLKIKALAA